MKTIDFLDQDKNAALSELCRVYLDTNMLDSALYYLSNDNSLLGSCMLVPVAVSRDTALASSHLSVIRNEANISAMKGDSMRANELSRFCDYCRIMLKFNSKPGGYFELNDQERNQLTNIQNSDESVNVNANAILTYLNNNLAFKDVPPYPVEARSDQIEVMDEISYNNTLRAYPNPFSPYLRIAGEIESDFNNCSIEIYSVVGKLVFTDFVYEHMYNLTVNTEHFNSGMYLIQLKVDGEIIESLKVIK